ncbi:ABC transporter ATP-binding protein [Paracoccus siganidrum]|uniref:ABC transporter ATP-binding protein n=1 Tax=Paracoccus siganidrum TaxID=1276757 RepID=A0A419A3V2_9RHOB|nr:ABC transporter ATP-binding protein [Paracoccus siganidrum]RJL08221.1 ABC transporter ATP-binding protein [Paracoccus siganidrum]RMC35214.1 ABC transporter ATP-binding protein [Paracoccus siganidrum]
MSEVVLQDVAKHYGDAVAVRNMTLRIADGELVALLGPSGCGKTTTLRMIAGFVDATSGRISVGGRDVTGLPPNRRNMGMVFQNYALFPHMTVAQNVAFGLEMRKVSRADAGKRVREALARVRLGQYGDRLPKQLSGGQQQRVALARALVIEPDVLLLDEPLSNLDAALRHEMKIEIRQLQQSLGLTTVFVTHDQDEAMSTADRMVLMYQGGVEQIGPPAEVFGRPRTAFAAGFLGIPNLLAGRMTPDRAGFAFEAGPTVRLQGQPPIAGRAFLALRPEEISLSTEPPATGRNALAGRVEIMTYHGSAVEYQLRTDAGPMLSARLRAPGLGGQPVLPGGTAVWAHWAPEAGVLVNEH